MRRDVQAEIYKRQSRREEKVKKEFAAREEAKLGQMLCDRYNNEGIPLVEATFLNPETKEILAGYVSSLVSSKVKKDKSMLTYRSFLGIDVSSHLYGWYFQNGMTTSGSRGEGTRHIQSFISDDLMLSKAYNDGINDPSKFNSFRGEAIQNYVIEDLARRDVLWVPPSPTFPS